MQEEQFTVDFGRAEEQEHFAKTYRLFGERMPALQDALKVSFGCARDTAGLNDKAVFYLGLLCCEDFNEILLLCNYGFGSGALKIMRGMYERVVTARYLDTNPGEAENFFNFHWVQQRRSGNAIKIALELKASNVLGLEIDKEFYDRAVGNWNG